MQGTHKRLLSVAGQCFVGEGVINIATEKQPPERYMAFKSQ